MRKFETNYIYKITCKDTGRFYIGHSKDPYNRGHLNFIKNGARGYWKKYPKWKEDYDKFGEDSFEIEILASINTDDLKTVLWLEDYFIMKYNAIESGYNNELNYDKSERYRKKVSENTTRNIERYRISRSETEFKKWEPLFGKIIYCIENKCLGKNALMEKTGLKESIIRGVFCLSHSSLKFIKFENGELKVTKI